MQRQADEQVLERVVASSQRQLRESNRIDIDERVLQHASVNPRSRENFSDLLADRAAVSALIDTPMPVHGSGEYRSLLSRYAHRHQRAISSTPHASSQQSRSPSKRHIV